jgi:hypothetical protein
MAVRLPSAVWLAPHSACGTWRALLEDTVEYLQLVRLALRLDALPRLVRGHLLPREQQVLADDAPHLLLRLLHHLVREGCFSARHVEIIVKTPLDRWPDRDLRAAVHALHGHRHDVRARVADAQQLVRLIARRQWYAGEVGRADWLRVTA